MWQIWRIRTGRFSQGWGSRCCRGLGGEGGGQPRWELWGSCLGCSTLTRQARKYIRTLSDPEKGQLPRLPYSSAGMSLVVVYWPKGGPPWSPARETAQKPVNSGGVCVHTLSPHTPHGVTFHLTFFPAPNEINC